MEELKAEEMEKRNKEQDDDVTKRDMENTERNERIIWENMRNPDDEAREGEARTGASGIAYAVFGALALMASIIGLGIGAAGIIGVVKLIGWLLSL